MLRATLITALLALVLSAGARAGEVDVLLASDTPPHGVVFEFASGDQELLEQHLPALRGDITRLRERFPDLSIEIVSHGLEVLSLTIENEDFYPWAHRVTRELAREGIPLTVCGAYAESFGVFAEEFPYYVQVLPSGPAHMDNLMQLDYILVRYPPR
ncbi:MAG TPA: hypothetical protein ENN42_02440 [Thioalkalivibrio sp.]|nr:hypothetical protein [Thioalkalivibrio sp.]